LNSEADVSILDVVFRAVAAGFDVLGVGERAAPPHQEIKFVYKHRHLVVKRRENFTESESGDLTRMLEYLPELGTLRRFADRIYWLFETDKDFHQASCRRAAILRESAFHAVPELVKAMDQLSEETFPKIMAYLNSPAGERVRTNNHVERTNRMVRFFEKVRYKWRRRKTLVRFVVLRLDQIWANWSPPAAKANRRPKEAKPRKRRRDDGLQPCRAA
jgi:Transposase